MNYKQSEGESVTTDTGLWIPADPENTDWQAYQQWLAEGNTPDPRFSEDELKAKKLAEVSLEVTRLRAIADYTIKPLQDAVDIDEAGEEDLVALKLWKKYRIALSKIEAQPDYSMNIDWPASPATDLTNTDPDWPVPPAQ